MVKEELMENWQQRTELLLGAEKMERLRKSHVLVVGLGGVGAYAAEMICRAGVGRMTIVDADIVQPLILTASCRLLMPLWVWKKRRCWKHVSEILIRK